MVVELRPGVSKILTAPLGSPMPTAEEMFDNAVAAAIALGKDVSTHARLKILSNGFPIALVLKGDKLAHAVGIQLVAHYLGEHDELEIASAEVIREVESF
jgi:hypothetical protein